IAASTTPKTSAMTPAAPVSLRINRNDDRYTARLAGSEKTCTGHLQRPPGPAPAPADRSTSLAAGEFAGVQRRRRLTAPAERRVPRRLVPAVGRGSGQDGVDFLAAGLVALLQPDPVGLGAERLADHLELPGELRLCGVPGEDDVIGGDGVHAALAQRLHALGVRVEQLQV